MASTLGSSGISDTQISIQAQGRDLPPLITLIRHPQTLANQAHLLQGSTDSDLTALGQSQLQSLAEKWKSLHKDQVTLIVSSPLGRTRKLAEALQESAFQQGDRTSPFTNDSAFATKMVIYRDGLKERDFGGLESSRKGKYVQGFPKGRGSGETKDKFIKRVKSEAQILLAIASGKLRLQDADGPSGEVTRTEATTAHQIDIKGKRKVEDDQSSLADASPSKKCASTSSFIASNMACPDSGQMETAKGTQALTTSNVCGGFVPSGNTSRSAQTSSTSLKQSGSSSNSISGSVSALAPRQRSHLVIVTHGLWLSTFFKLHNLNLPFAHNTGVYTLSIHYEMLKNSFSSSPREQLSLRVLKANDIRHLTGISGTNGVSSARSRDKFALVGSDPKQKKLEGFLTKKV